MTTDMTQARVALLRRAADYYGTEALASHLGVKPRAFYRWLDGSRNPRSWSDVLTRTRDLLAQRRGEIGTLVQALRVAGSAA